MAWYKANSESKTHSVGCKQANELGIYDMSVNVSELCNDWSGNYSSSAQTNPKGADSGNYRVSRGGSRNYYTRLCRVADRSIDRPGGSIGIGFRLTRSSN